MLITSGPTHEPIDPVRYIANRSSGKQGHAIAAAAAAAGARRHPGQRPGDDPRSARRDRRPRRIRARHARGSRERAAGRRRDLRRGGRRLARRQCRQAEDQEEARPGHARTGADRKPDILSTIAHRKTDRPPLVIGFAAETENVIANASAKLARKGCDWILANDVSPATGIMGGDTNTIQFVQTSGIEPWPPQSKDDVAAMLIERIAARWRRQSDE